MHQPVTRVSVSKLLFVQYNCRLVNPPNQIAMKPFIVVGDKTSHGGVVIGGSPTSDINGKGIARVGDKVTCPKKGCPSINSIATTSDPTVIVDGMPGAFHGDMTACGATLVSSQFATNSDPRRSDGGCRANVGTASAALSAFSNNDEEEVVEQFYELVDAEDNPVEGYRYDLFSDGTTIKQSGDLSTGTTVAERGNAGLALVAWLNKAGAIKS
jgi:uncharacterized Zn-binding protein involved in type VI secretion